MYLIFLVKKIFKKKNCKYNCDTLYLKEKSKKKSL